MGAFSLDKSDGIAIITFDLPDEPVNKFSAPVRDELIKLFDNVRDDPSVSAVAFCSGKPDVFIAGCCLVQACASPDALAETYGMPVG